MLRNCTTLLLGLAFLTSLVSQDAADEIRTVLNTQSIAWNKGDIEGFMEGYVKTADLHFLGDKGLTAGWQATLDNYKRAYPDRDAMGELKFEIHEITYRTDDAYTVVGQYFLSRKTLDDLDGYFLLVVIKTDDGWRIAADSTH